MKNKKLFILILMIIVISGVLSFWAKDFWYGRSDDSVIMKLVDEFGRNLQNVTLQAPKEAREELMKENYNKYVTPELLSKWINDSSKALGRIVSSPWPDRIEVKSINRINENKFIVAGEIVEMTNTGEANRQEITLTVERQPWKIKFPFAGRNLKWLITDVNLHSIDDTISNTIDDTISNAIKTRNQDRYYKGEVATEGHIILDIEEKDNIIKVYTIASFGYFGFENGVFTMISGSGAIPTVITFSKNEKDGYSLLEYKEPMDGALYMDSLKKMFPKKLHDAVLSADKYYPELVKQKEAQAAEYLKSIGRTAKVSAAYVEKKLLNINVQASNRLFGGKENPFLNEYPYWLGTRERVENGVRYIYKTYQSKTNDNFDLVIFKKTKEDGTIVEEYRFKIVESEPLLVYKKSIK